MKGSIAFAVALALVTCACGPSPDRFCSHMERLQADYANAHPAKLKERFLPSDAELERIHGECVKRAEKARKREPKKYASCASCLMKIDRVEDEKDCRSECRD